MGAQVPLYQPLEAKRGGGGGALFSEAPPAGTGGGPASACRRILGEGISELLGVRLPGYAYDIWCALEGFKGSWPPALVSELG